MWVLLLVSAALQTANLVTGSVQLNSTLCEFELASVNCGWRVLTSVEGTTGIASAANLSDHQLLAPSNDFNPGTDQGHYMFFFSHQVQQSVRILSYPSHYSVCAISFAYYLIGPIDLEILRVNSDLQTVAMGDVTNDTTWQRSEVNLNTSDSDFGELVFRVSQGLDFGEAMLDPNSPPSLFLGLDDIILTFCVSCDYDMLKEVDGGFVVGGPERIDILLRRVTQYNINASIPMCPNETLVFSILSIEPEHVSSIFSMDANSGVLTVHGNGAGLDANGTTGTINVSVAVMNSNYSYGSPLYSKTTVIAFTQPPTITYTAPSSHTISLGMEFSYDILISSFLSRLEQLVLGQPTTEPPELATDITIIRSNDDPASISVSGVVSIDRILPLIVQRNIISSISIPISDSYGGLVVLQTLLHIPIQPPIFNQSTYTFSVMEESGAGVHVGQISLIDPNGHQIAVPSIVDQTAMGFFLLLPSDTTPPYSAYDIITQLRIDYEQYTRFEFEVSVADTVDSTLTSATTLTVNILPVNEYSPSFINNRLDVIINDIAIRGSQVGLFTATDEDADQDGVIVYSITEGNEDGFFEIVHDRFGEVTVRVSPLLPQTYTLTITASDEGTPHHSANATLIVHVITTSIIDCTQSQFGPPYVSSELQHYIEPVGVNLSLECMYIANPTARSYKWITPNGIVSQNNSHYSVSEFSLSLTTLTTNDAGLYTCNVTNQCGFDTVAYILDVIDVPGPPLDLQVTIDDAIIRLSWEPPTYLMPSHFVLRPLDSYNVEVRQEGKTQFRLLMEVDGSVTNTTINTLHPGTTYDVRVVAFNTAGAGTPSETNTITTNASVPRLEYLQATGLDNNSLLIEWSVEYDGGFPITSFEIHVIQDGIREKRAPPRTYVINDISAGRYVTQAYEQGHTYTLSATAQNALGSSESHMTSAFIGTTDSMSCDFETINSCLWVIEDGAVITQAQGAPNDQLPPVDSSHSSLGFYVYGSSAVEAIVLSYPLAGYVCGFSFSYWLYGNESSRLFLRSSNSNSNSIIWTTSETSSSWQNINTTQDKYLTSDLDNQLQFIVVSGGVAIDDIALKFCLPCDFDDLRDNQDSFSLSYSEYNELYLRTTYTLTLQATLGKCSNAVLNSSIIRVIPSDLTTSLSLSAAPNHTIHLSIEPISTDLAEPGTLGLIELSVGILHSNYQPNSEIIQKIVVLEFALLETSENCSIARSCDFESGSCDWLVLGVETSMVDEGSVQQHENRYIYANGTTPVVIATTIINDDYCAVSFVYSVNSSLELEVTVDGLGVIWSSILDTEPTTRSEWVQESIQIDLQAINIQVNRSLSFQLSTLTEGFGEAGLDRISSGSVALDNITLHPCFNCDTPECVFSSCVPGHYFSLAEEMCVECPQGYYCPDWRLLPKPCPPGTYSTTVNSALIKNCLPCPNQSFTLRPGSVSCETCPEGYDCSNSSAYPLQNSCPTCSSCPVTIETTLSSATFPLVPVLAVVGTVGGVLVFLCLFLMCLVICCWKRRDKSKHRKSNRTRFDAMSIGSAGSLGRSSNSSTFTSLGGKRWKGGKDTQTLMSFLGDEEPGGLAGDPYYNESSWRDTEEMTKNSGEPITATQEDNDETVELSNFFGWQKTKGSRNTTSQF